MLQTRQRWLFEQPLESSRAVSEAAEEAVAAREEAAVVAEAVVAAVAEEAGERATVPRARQD